MPTSDNQNAFELLCRLASKERWCWKIPCTTCGNQEFQYGLRELGRGHSPAESEWVVHKGVQNLREKLGEFQYPRNPDCRIGVHYPYHLADPDKVAIVQVCAGADLKTIADECLFPDWLGYLGLVLYRMRCPDVAYNNLLALWAWQLRDFVQKYSIIWSHLGDCARQSDQQLSFGDLETVEFAMRDLQMASEIRTLGREL